MKFWCASANSSKQQKSLNKKTTQFNNSLSSSVSYATISSIPIPKSDSGYSDTSSIVQTYSCLEQIHIYERTYHESLKAYIIKYSRPLRRYLNPDEIVDLFQNIEKISAISESIVRQCEKLLLEGNTSNISISMIYQSWFDVMYDSYNTYISRSIKAQAALNQCQNKISYCLQVPIEFVTREIREFILLPIRHICILNDLFQHYDLINMIEDVNFLSQQAKYVLQLSHNDQISISGSSQDITLQSEIAPIIVLQRTDKEPWKSKQLEISDSRLSFINLDQSSANRSICLSNVAHVTENSLYEELCLIIAPTMRQSSRYSSVEMKRVYIRFEDKNDYCIWLHYLTNAIQDAKDQSWSKTNEVLM